MTSFATLECHRSEAVATLILNRPKALNALNGAMLEDLEKAFDQLASDPEVRVILLTGSGDRAFAAGADIRELLRTDADSGRAVSEHGQRVFLRIEQCRKPVIACLNGVALGGGLELALACTLRLASETAQLGLPELRLGLIPGFGGVHRLIRLIGRGAALKLLLVAQTVNAAEALRLGLVEEVVPAAALLDRARELAHTIAGMAPLAVRGILDAVQQIGNQPEQEGFRTETDIFTALCQTADKTEGLTAFLEKRPAQWQGR